MAAYAVDGVYIEEFKETAEVIERRTNYWTKLKRPSGLFRRFKEMMSGLKKMEEMFDHIIYNPIADETRAQEVLRICTDIRPSLERISSEGFWPLTRRARKALEKLNKVVEGLEISFDEELIDYIHKVDR